MEIRKLVTSVPYGRGAELRQWLRENIGKPYDDWQTWPAITDDTITDDFIGVTVYNDEHLTLVALRWS